MTSKRRNKDKRRRQRRTDRSLTTSSYKAANRSVETVPCADGARSDIIEPSMMKRLDCKVAKVDDSFGIVFGWAIISTEDGSPYVDTQRDHIPDPAMMKASVNYAKGKRAGADMHRVEDGTILFLFPLTAEMSKAFDIECNKTGLMVGMAPDNEETLAKFRSGERTGFSIGGRRVEDTPRTMELS